MTTQMIFDKITPTDVRVYIEDGVPYLDYIGTVMTGMGKAKVHIPKIGLNITAVSKEEDIVDSYDMYNNKVASIRTRLEIFAENDRWCECKIIEREMSKEQIEKELGYKVKIK